MKDLMDFKPDTPIIITEGEKKAACAVKHGFAAIGLPGVRMFKDSENEFLPELEGISFEYRKVYIVFDSDIITKHHVRHAELRLAVELINRGAAEVLAARLPNEPDGAKNGLDDYIVRHGKEAFEERLEEARPWLDVQVEEAPTDLIVKEVSRLVSYIERERAVGVISSKLGVPKDAVRRDIERHRSKQTQPLDRQESQPDPLAEYTEEEIAQAHEVLNCPDILDRMVEMTEEMGHVGEVENKKLLYLAFTSRKMEEGISLVVKGDSAAGKNALVNAVLQLIPPDDVHRYTAISEKALLHFPKDLNHKILFVAEHEGSRAADYSIRTSISEGELSLLVTEKDEKTGKLEATQKRVPAKGMVFVETTTKERVHPENQTRLFDIYVDESPEQTARILRMKALQAEKGAPNNEALVKVWRCMQELLNPYEVVIPYASQLAGFFPTDKLRARRDFPRLLSLIKAHALLYQKQRRKSKDGKVIAELSDLEGVLPLIEIVVAQSLM